MLVRVVVQLGSLAVLARLLEPSDFGLMSMVVVVTGFAHAFADFGLSNAVIHRQDATHDQLSSVYWLNVMVGFGIFGLILLSVPAVVAYYQDPRVAYLLRWAAISYLFIPLGQQFQALLRRDLRFREVSLIQMSQSLVYAGGAVSLAFAGFGVMSLVLGTVLQAAVGAVLLVYAGFRHGWLPRLHFQWRELHGFAKFGLFQMGERSLNFMSNNIDYVLIGRFLGSEALGFYTLAYNIIRIPLSYLNPVVVSVAFPAFARRQNQDGVLRRGYCKVLHYLSALTFPAMAGIAVVAPLLVPLIYGDTWSPAIPVVQVFSLLGALKSLGNPIGSLLLAKGRADLGFFWNVLGLFGCGVANALGLSWGIIGVAASTLAFVTLVNFPLGFWVRRRLIQMTAAEFWNAIRKPAGATVIMLLIIVPASHLLSSALANNLSLGIVVALGMATYINALWLLDSKLIVEVRGYLKATPSTR